MFQSNKQFSLIPLFSKPIKQPDAPFSYKTICLLFFSSKLYKKLTLKRIYPNIKNNNLIPEFQAEWEYIIYIIQFLFVLFSVVRSS